MEKKKKKKGEREIEKKIVVAVETFRDWLCNNNGLGDVYCQASINFHYLVLH